ncbi:MAG: ABC transporter ATP-binding protein [SAR324 cluster bacterium]|nr:ABC transporter ATP-binding protein [SAR324 cluster bacterium]MCZ6531872.1 ABC transporter ATP-binding protein [SAR324 cluster bacterium]
MDPAAGALQNNLLRGDGMSEAVLRVEGLTKRYGRFTALRDLSFSVAKGEVVGLLGQNGAGKSTTIKIICNLVRPTAGEVYLEGQPVTGQRSGEHRRKMGVIVEAPRFYPLLSGRANLELLARIYGAGDGRAAALLEQVGLSERQEERFGRYSMGMKQRLGLAAVLLNEPSLVVLDEPTTGLDPVAQLQIHDLILKLTREHQVSALMCSHILSEVETLCHRALVLHRGELLLEQSLREKDGIAEVAKVFKGIADELQKQGDLQ